MGNKQWSGRSLGPVLRMSLTFLGSVMLPAGVWLAGAMVEATRGENRAIAGPVSSLARPDAPIQVSQVPGGGLLQQGTQVNLNGRVVPAAWIQWQTAAGPRIGVSDAGLLRAIGLQLLSTNSTAFQPVQWFSQPNVTPLNLPIRLSGGLRYLDITDLARQFGWQMGGTGTALQIVTTPAKILTVRQAKQPWGDRLVIELDRPTPWQSDQQTQELLITLDGAPDPTLLQQFRSSSGVYIQSIKLEALGNQTRLRLAVPNTLNPRIWSLVQPNRLVIDIRPDSLVEQNILWAPGLRWRQQILPLGSNRVPVVWLEINLRQPGLAMRPIVPNSTTMAGIAPLAQTAQLAQAAAAINGGFFNRNRQLPLGAVRRDGRWLSGPILNRGAIAWDGVGNVRVDRLTLRETVITQTGQRLPLTHLNSGYVQAGIARYTSDWGPAYTSLSDGEVVVTVQNNQVFSQQVIEKAGTISVPFPPNGYLLVLRSNRSATSAFPVGMPLQVESVTVPFDLNQFPHVVAAGPLLIQNRQVVLDPRSEGFSPAFISEAAPRSAIARTADGTILLVAAHRRLDGVELTLTDMAQLLQQLGAVDALNLDGGSSTTLYLGGQILDRPPRTSARVHNGIGVFFTSP